MESIWNFICEYATLGNISQVSVILSAVFVAYQAHLFRKDFQVRNEHSAFNISYQLAKYYAEKILPRIGAANNIIRKISQQAVPAETLKEKIVDFSAFTEPEATTLFSKNAIEKFHNDYRHCVDEDMLAQFFSIYHGIPYLEIKNDWEKTLSNATPEEREQFYKDLSHLMQRNIADVFNHLEYLSMYFYSGLADSDTVAEQGRPAVGRIQSEKNRGQRPPAESPRVENQGIYPHHVRQADKRREHGALPCSPRKPYRLCTSRSFNCDNQVEGAIQLVRPE